MDRPADGICGLGRISSCIAPDVAEAFQDSYQWGPRSYRMKLSRGRSKSAASRRRWRGIYHPPHRVRVDGSAPRRTDLFRSKVRQLESTRAVL